MAGSRSGNLAGKVQEGLHAILLAGRRARLGMAGLAGVIAAAALQPIEFFPAFLVAFPLLVLLMDSAHAERVRGAKALVLPALLGWCFGFGYFVAGLWWLGAAFITGGEQFIWLLPLGVIGLPALLAFFPALGLALARLFWSPGPLRIFALVFGLGFSEWLRSWLFTGFPWNGFAQAFANYLWPAQIISVIGAEGLGLVTILVFAAPVLIITGRDRRERWLLPALSACVMLGIVGFGIARLQPAGGLKVDFTSLPLVKDVRLRIMQPNIPQDLKNATTDGAAVLAKFLRLSDVARGAHASGIADVTHLFWPEAPLPFVLERAPQAIDEITRFLPAQTQLLTGSIRAEPIAGAERRFRFYNSLQILDRSGITGTYDKLHLVPFGEFLPFDSLLRALGLEQFVNVIGGFTAGDLRRPLVAAGLPPLVPMICFESIFPRELAGDGEQEAVFINVTNDAWFGYTFGPYQHFAQARMRAVEFGRPLVRAANSGISAVVDPYGRLLASLPVGVEDVIDSPLPAPLPKTLYHRTSWYSFASVMICALILALLGRVAFFDKRRN